MNETLIKVNNSEDVDTSTSNNIPIIVADENNSQKDNNPIENNQNLKNENTPDYDFLNEDKKSVNDADLVTTQFDAAFKKASPVIQKYILSDKFEENIKLICKIEKLDNDKAKVIIENITVSILVGLLPISVAKDTMIESFRSSGVILESFTASMIMKSIDTYILTDIRKQILESKVTSNREIRHLTLKEQKDEAVKEDLRKILLERTGNISGAGQPLIQYQHRDLSKERAIASKINSTNTETGNPKTPVLNRQTLLNKLGLTQIDNTEKALDRMREIKQAETIRLEDKDNDRVSVSYEPELKNSTISNHNSNLSSKVSDNLANILQNKLNRKEDELVNLDNLREERGMKEAQNENIDTKADFNLKNKDIKTYSKDVDPYRETIT